MHHRDDRVRPVRWWAAAAALALLTVSLGGCTSSGAAVVFVRALWAQADGVALTGGAVRLVATVTGPDLVAPVAGEVAGPEERVRLEVPPGLDRLVTLEAFDAAGGRVAGGTATEVTYAGAGRFETSVLMADSDESTNEEWATALVRVVDTSVVYGGGVLWPAEGDFLDRRKFLLTAGVPAVIEVALSSGGGSLDVSILRFGPGDPPEGTLVAANAALGPGGTLIFSVQPAVDTIYGVQVGRLTGAAQYEVYVRTPPFTGDGGVDVGIE